MYVKNGMPYFKRALESVLGQSYKNIEVIVVDGGSTDGTKELADQYAINDRRVHVLSCDKGSVGAQFNMGLEYASGKYVAIVESDDYILPEMYEKEIAIADETGCDILRADNYIFYGPEGQEHRIRIEISHDHSLYERVIRHAIEPEHAMLGGSFWTGLYRRDFLLKQNIKMNESSGAAYQDLGFLFLATSLADTIYMMPDAYYCYRKDNPGSSCNSPTNMLNVQTECQFLRSELKKRGIWEQNKETYITWKIRNELWFCSCLSEEKEEEYSSYLYADLRQIIQPESIEPDNYPVREAAVIKAVLGGEEDLKNLLHESRAYQTDLIDKINCLSDEQQIYIFGAGNVGEIMVSVLERHGLYPAAFVDNNSLLWGTEKMGLNVIGIDDVLNEEDGFFIICSEFYSLEIRNQLLKHGIPRDRLAVCSSMDGAVRLLISD